VEEFQMSIGDLRGGDPCQRSLEELGGERLGMKKTAGSRR
jgi:hypothetical protein